MQPFIVPVLRNQDILVLKMDQIKLVTYLMFRLNLNQKQQMFSAENSNLKIKMEFQVLLPIFQDKHKNKMIKLQDVYKLLNQWLQIL